MATRELIRVARSTRGLRLNSNAVANDVELGAAVVFDVADALLGITWT
jgi:hypothetical protein